MPGLLDLLNSDLGKTIVSGIAGQTGQGRALREGCQGSATGQTRLRRNGRERG